MTVNTVAQAIASGHVGTRLFKKLLNDLEIIASVVIEVLRRDYDQNLVNGLDGVLDVVAVLVGASQAPLQILVKVFAHFGQLLWMLFHIVLKLFHFDLDEWRVEVARINVVYFLLVLRVEAAACTA